MRKIETAKSSTNSLVQQTTSDNHQTTEAKPELDGLVTPKTLAASEELHTDGSVTIAQDRFESSTGLFAQPTTSNNYQTTKIELEPERSVTPKNLSLSENPHTYGPVDSLKEKLEKLSTASKLAALPDEIILSILRQIYESIDQQSRFAFFVLRQFAARDNKDWVYCYKCFVEPPSSCFSREELQKESKRVCIAKTGYVRLCEHKVLFWDDIEPQTTRAGGFIEIENCTHPSHLENDLPHSEIPNAKISGYHGGKLSLSLSLTVVSAERCRNLVTCQTSNVAADQVLEAIQSLRRHGAQCIVPERSTKAPLEMDAFITLDNPATEVRMWTPIRKWPKGVQPKDRDDWGKHANGLSVFCEPRHYGPDKSITRLCFLYERKTCVRNSDRRSWNVL
ncbi:hypothetical protein FBULB1_8768 [Fusarium bulbicola]|nr:hypothetical protein FBULB1_8768 [Fusarium bulbicola]